MTKLNPVPTNKVIKVLEKAGFKLIRQTGSHKFYEHPNGNSTVILKHSNKDIDVNILKLILKQTKISREEWFELLKNIMLL